MMAFDVLKCEWIEVHIKIATFIVLQMCVYTHMNFFKSELIQGPIVDYSLFGQPEVLSIDSNNRAIHLTYPYSSE